MLVPAPYKVPKKTVEKEAKKTRGGLRRRGTSDTISEGSDAHSASEEDEEEEEDESPMGERKKRTATTHLEAESPKRGKAPLSEESAAATNSGPAWDPKAQPRFVVLCLFQCFEEKEYQTESKQNEIN